MTKPHIHKFVKPVTQKVRVHSGNGPISAVDTLKQWQCECGAKITYDLERMKV